MTTTTEAIDAFTQALRTQNNKALYNIGITTDITALPSYDRFAHLGDWVFVPRWPVYLKRVFQSRKYKRYTKEYIEVSLRLQQEFMEAMTE